MLVFHKILRAYLMDEPKESVKSEISEISIFKINLRAKRIITIKPLSSNFIKTELINEYFYEGST